MRLLNILFRRCPHDHIRCVHGDEINHADGKRRACMDCGAYLKGPLPLYCTVTGGKHTHIVDVKKPAGYY